MRTGGHFYPMGERRKGGEGGADSFLSPLFERREKGGKRPAGGPAAA